MSLVNCFLGVAALWLSCEYNNNFIVQSNSLYAVQIATYLFKSNFEV